MADDATRAALRIASQYAGKPDEPGDEVSGFGPYVNSEGQGNEN
jgi:hypothetical protein